MTGVHRPFVTDPLANADRLFRSLARPRLDALAAARLRLARHDAPRTALADIGAIAHQIAGTAATLGYAELGRAATEVERLAAIGAPPDAITPALGALAEALGAVANP